VRLAIKGVSVISIYRKLKILSDNKIVTPLAIISKEGKKIFFIKPISRTYRHGLIRIE